MNVRVEAAKCDGYGTCATHFPELFKLDEWGYAYIDGDGAVTPGDEDRARRAILDCPVHAIGELGS